MPGYLFLTNSTKPSKSKLQSRELVTLDNVSRPCIHTAINNGYDVWFGINRDDPSSLTCEVPVKLFDSHTYRSLLAFRDNWIAFKNVSKIIRENDIKVIHCNSPIGGLIGRVCGKIYNVPYVLYTAHGFHFFKGASIFNNTVIKYAEMMMAHWTNIIITINKEDYYAAKKFKLRKKGRVYYVPGVGINTRDYSVPNFRRDEYRSKLGIKPDDLLLISIGDLNKNKNHISMIKALSLINNRNLHYVICGEGEYREKILDMAAKLGLNKRVHLLGYRSDVKELLLSSDIFLLPSYREGLSRSVIEAMASGLPCIVSDIRGNRDLIIDSEGGFLCNPNKISEFSSKINQLANDSELRQKMGEYNKKESLKYDYSSVKPLIEKIYSGIEL